MSESATRLPSSRESVNMGTVTLKDFWGSKVLLVFGRYFGRPVCMLDFDKLLSMLQNGLPGVEIVYFTQSSPEAANFVIDGEGMVVRRTLTSSIRRRSSRS